MIMKIVKYIIAFIACWIISSLTLYLLDNLLPINYNEFIKILIKSFGISVMIIIILYLAINKR